MDLYDEQRLRDEVIYLHSLWHQGPPTHNNPAPQQYSSSSNLYTPNRALPSIYSHPQPHHLPNPNPNPIYRPNFIHNPSTILHHPINPTPFKLNKKKKKKKKPKMPSDSNPPPDSGIEWPCQKRVIESPKGWASSKPQSVQPLSPEENKKFDALKVQQTALSSCCKFFEQKNDDDDESDEENCFDEEDENEMNEEHVFFMRVFVEDSELRSYYEKNYEGGEFCCLVCSGIGKRVWKRFKDCLGLLQHSVAISKTKKKRAHRAYGKVVCNVLGWDIKRLPMIVRKGDPLSQSLAQSRESQGEPKENAVANMDESGACKDTIETSNGNNAEPACGEGYSVPPSNDGSTLSENTLKDDDCHKHTEKFDSGIGVNEGVAVDCQVSTSRDKDDSSVPKNTVISLNCDLHGKADEGTIFESSVKGDDINDFSKGCDNKVLDMGMNDMGATTSTKQSTEDSVGNEANSTQGIIDDQAADASVS